MNVRFALAPLALAAVLACLGGGCRSVVPPPVENLSDPAVMTYGAAPAPTSSVRLQPDVVIVKGGARAIRSATADGRTWTIDGQAPGAKDLAVGRVMFMTSRAVGRVVRVEPRGPDLAVTLAPVGLTDVIKDANITIDQELSPAMAVYQEGAEVTDVLPDQASVAVPRLVPAAWTQSAPSAKRDAMEEARKTSGKVSVGPFDVEPYLNVSTNGANEINRLGVRLATGVSTKFKLKGNSGSHGFKFGTDLSLYGQKLTLRAQVAISNGQFGSGTSLLLDGIERMDIGLFGGAEHGNSDNVKVRVEVPIDVTVPIPPAATDGIPFVFHFKVKFLVDTAFSGNNSTLKAHGLYSLAGAIGVERGTVLVPVFGVVEPMIDSLGGVPVGVSGVVLGVEFRFLLGFGTADWQAGPYVKVITAVGVTRGSAVGGLGGCARLTLKLDAGCGFGVQVSQAVEGWLKNVLGKDPKFKVAWEPFETMLSIFNKSMVRPNILACGGTGG
jgi:hypothetical protein